ncbi:MAG: hypothetical protein CFE21_03040 [Bacteroidetes bacterium B1(2017)]|nr:MAG: hypothetical protein CFE21_03040 [Bacteroidetes bacterium B1(2017)]
MSSTYSIISCGLKHKALLAELGSSTFYEAFGKFHTQSDMDAYTSKTYNLKAMEANLTASDISYFVSYDSKKDLGYIKLLHDVKIEGLIGKTMELEKIYIRQEAYGTGVANALMEKAIEESNTAKCQNLFLGVWNENVRALAFYKKWGFEIFSTRTFQLGDTLCNDYLLCLKLGAN